MLQRRRTYQCGYVSSIARRWIHEWLSVDARWWTYYCQSLALRVLELVDSYFEYFELWYTYGNAEMQIMYNERK